MPRCGVPPAAAADAYGVVRHGLVGTLVVKTVSDIACMTLFFRYYLKDKRKLGRSLLQLPAGERTPDEVDALTVA